MLPSGVIGENVAKPNRKIPICLTKKQRLSKKNIAAKKKCNCIKIKYRQVQ